jgi:predicted SprT family Zn-dependent metalloprotease
MKPMETYDVLREAFSFFNTELFDNRLSDCIILLHRKRGANGYFWADQFGRNGSKKTFHEIALNPEQIRARQPRDTFGTLAHEMVHQLQQEHGTPPKGAYHDRQWAGMMKNIGLQPDDGNGKETGRKVSHRIIENGRFDVTFKKFEKKYNLELFGTIPQGKKEKGKTSKFKFECPDCGQNAWAKECAALICGECGDVQMRRSDSQ